MAFADPKNNIDQLGRIEGMKIADFGAGTGAYSIPLAKKVGDSGRVYAIEVQKSFLLNISTAALQENLTNVKVLWGDIEILGSSGLADQIIDIVVIANVFFSVEDKKEVVAEASRVLVPKGQILFIDWKDSYGGVGPQPDMVVSPEKTRELFEQGGFFLEKEFPAGDHHYGFIFTKK
ncbi:methyltransferase domain-containing protein [Patescibacteria group bacterium]|nr:methyltransferase domain-containing protein [Patescibacteria group bacterium]MBU1246477.1 methyltransferase domain-containing protein [Patescibacteria group bacterium]MBU1519239.1 methyltransferase domain-containing protein [Patescibacteria group bacterium]MBU1730019.1 methyltransferase domain-containing protein [Patescibacteria group bacterium]MBU1956279.1 methyltransferase domain-containing protein [Patescibacteria group bacterium]